MWLLQWLPNWVFHLILLLGLLGLGASFLLKFFPSVAPYKVLIQVVASLMIVLGVYMEGAISNQAWWELRVAEAEKRVAEAEKKAAEANGKIEYVIVEKTKVVEVVDHIIPSYRAANRFDASLSEQQTRKKFLLKSFKWTS